MFLVLGCLVVLELPLLPIDEFLRWELYRATHNVTLLARGVKCVACGGGAFDLDRLAATTALELNGVLLGVVVVDPDGSRECGAGSKGEEKDGCNGGFHDDSGFREWAFVSVCNRSFGVKYEKTRIPLIP